MHPFPQGPSTSHSTGRFPTMHLAVISKHHFKTDAVNQDVACFQPCDGLCIEGTAAVHGLHSCCSWISRLKSPIGNDIVLHGANQRCFGVAINKSVLVTIPETD